MAADPAAAAAECRKRPRGGGGAPDLRRAAEIVMVLSGLGDMRAGREPSAAERAMAAEAKGLLAAACEGLKPRELFSREAVRGVVEDLGLNRSGAESQGRPKKLSIAEKLLVTKKKMEEKKDLPTHPPHPPHPHASLFPGAPRFIPSRPIPMAQNASPEIHVSDLSSATISFKQPHVNQTQPYDTFVPTSSLVRGCPSTGPSYVSQLRAVQSTSASTADLGQENKFLHHTIINSEGVHEGNASLSSQLIRSEGQTSVIQNTPGNPLIGHQPSQNITYAPTTSYITNHNDIAKSVLRVLQQHASSHPNWTVPLTDYMNKSVDCQICKIVINDMESVIVCDFCEKGTHLKCLQSYGSKGTPKGDWFCPKCVLASNGRTYPPKYGRVTRSIAISKASSNTVAGHASREKRTENSDSLINIKSEPNGHSDLPHLVSDYNVTSAESASDSKVTSATEMQGEDSSVVTKRADAMHIGTSTCQPEESGLMFCSTSGTQNESLGKQVESRGVLSSDMHTSSCELDSKVIMDQACSKYQNGTSEAAYPLKPLSDPQACNRVSALVSVEVSPNQPAKVGKPNTDELKLSEFEDLPKVEDDCDISPHEQINSQTSCDGSSDSGEASVDCGRQVDWVGDVLETVEGKTYYQSCWVNGSLHKLEDHVLLSSNSRDMHPCKLQSLWEETKTGSKWANVDTYYLPDDLSEDVNLPSTFENSEVYATNNRTATPARSIYGPCEVLPIDKFREESDRRTQIEDTNNDLHPIFLCRWLYDESKGNFQAVTNQ